MIPLITGTIKTIGLGNLTRLVELLPYAEIRGCNRVAVRVQDDVVKRLLPSRFILRTKWFTPRTRYGFNITKWARKEDRTAIVGSQAEWLKLQEEGGLKRPSRAKSVSVPLPGIRPDKSIVLRRSQRPRSLMRGRRSKAFVLSTSKGPVLYRREGPKLMPLYAFEKEVKIRPVLEFVKSERETVGKVYQEEFRKAFVELIAKHV